MTNPYRDPVFDVEGSLFLTFNKKALVNKGAIINEANRDLTKKNLTEIVKANVYGEENNLIRTLTD